LIIVANNNKKWYNKITIKTYS